MLNIELELEAEQRVFVASPSACMRAQAVPEVRQARLSSPVMKRERKTKRYQKACCTKMRCLIRAASSTMNDPSSRIFSCCCASSWLLKSLAASMMAYASRSAHDASNTFSPIMWYSSLMYPLLRCRRSPIICVSAPMEARCWMAANDEKTCTKAVKPHQYRINGQ